MPSFRVRVPFTEVEQGNVRSGDADFTVDAADFMEALRRAVERFEEDNRSDYHSWLCQIREDGIEVVDLETGRRFQMDGDAPALGERLVVVSPPAVPATVPDPPYADLVRILATDKTPRASVGEVLDLAMRALGAEAGSVLAKDERLGDLYFLEARGPKAADVKSYRLAMGVGIAGWCARRGETLTVADAATYPLFYERISREIGFDTKAIVCAPARVDGVTVGVLEVLNPSDSHIAPKQIAFVEACARLCGLLLTAGSE